jgi:hypothetical protein
MRITVSHRKDPREIMASLDRGFDDLFTGLPVAPLQITDERRNWSGNTMFFTFNARVAFMVFPVKGSFQVTPSEVIVEIDLPPLIATLIPEPKLKSGLETGVKGLLR